MKFKNIDGEQCIILDENDKIRIMSTESEMKKSIEVKSDGEHLDISGNSDLIGQIRGAGMLEKVYVPPILSKEEILEKCDEWFRMYRDVLDVFSGLVSTEKYVEQNIKMELSFNGFFNTATGEKGKTIDLELTRHSTVVQDGVAISIDEENEDVYKYLVARVIAYFLSTCFMHKRIDMGIEFDGRLYTSGKAGGQTNIAAYLGSLMDSDEYNEIIKKLLVAHNLDNSFDQIIDSLRDRIAPQQLASDRIDKFLKLSSVQHKYIKKGRSV